MKKIHEVKNVQITKTSISLIVDGNYIQKKLSELFPSLVRANDKERTIFEISPSGYGIHWPLIDEDISIDGLLGISHCDTKQSA